MSDQSQTSGTRCPTCGHHNREGIFFCEQCGTNLLTGSQHPRPTQRYDEEEPTLMVDEEQRAALADGVRTGIFKTGMSLRIEMSHWQTPLHIHPQPNTSLIFGRRDTDTHSLAMVDLAPYGAYPLGVSRRHMALYLEEDQLSIEDLGSSNGTYLNGVRLTPHKRYKLRDGDLIRLGKMDLQVHFE
ncbi:MAG: FHA domain-containing protein [Chloroflexi bacterium]|nr:MAG: FHA domain-containing protein [Chloroflexota bacterium]